jgi:hypothetical protein
MEAEFIFNPIKIMRVFFEIINKFLFERGYIGKLSFSSPDNSVKFFFLRTI